MLIKDAGICIYSVSSNLITSNNIHFQFRLTGIKEPRKAYSLEWCPNIFRHRVQIQSGSKIFPFVICQAVLATWLRQVWLCGFSAENIIFPNAKEWDLEK